MTDFSRSRHAATLVATLALLASCAHHRATVAVEAPSTVVAAPRPVLPAQYAAIVPPPRAADGGYATINHGIDGERTIWHVRAALNVAAIGCRSDADAALVPAYNALLKDQKAVLAAADAAVKAGFRQRLGPSWQGAHDVYMTQLYNFFAQPAAKAGFCAAADRIAPQAATIPTVGLAAFAQTALPELEAPFLATYRAVDDYRVALAAWSQTGAPRTQLAVATPAAGPHLAYAGISTLIAWQPDEDTRIASR